MLLLGLRECKINDMKKIRVCGCANCPNCDKRVLDYRCSHPSFIRGCYPVIPTEIVKHLEKKDGRDCGNSTFPYWCPLDDDVVAYRVAHESVRLH